MDDWSKTMSIIDYQNFNGCVQGTKDHPAPLPDWGGGKLLAGYPND